MSPATWLDSTVASSSLNSCSSWSGFSPSLIASKNSGCSILCSSVSSLIFLKAKDCCYFWGWVALISPTVRSKFCLSSFFMSLVLKLDTALLLLVWENLDLISSSFCLKYYLSSTEVIVLLDTCDTTDLKDSLRPSLFPRFWIVLVFKTCCLSIVS
jgi:hypothetical protein